MVCVGARDSGGGGGGGVVVVVVPDMVGRPHVPAEACV